MTAGHDRDQGLESSFLRALKALADAAQFQNRRSRCRSLLIHPHPTPPLVSDALHQCGKTAALPGDPEVAGQLAARAPIGRRPDTPGRPGESGDRRATTGPSAVDRRKFNFEGRCWGANREVHYTKVWDIPWCYRRIPLQAGLSEWMRLPLVGLGEARLTSTSAIPERQPSRLLWQADDWRRSREWGTNARPPSRGALL